MAYPRVPIEHRLLARLDISPGGCWRWTGGISDGGYGRIDVDGKTRATHRVAHELWVGPIPAGFTVNHRCEVKLCCRPDHLEAVTLRDNLHYSDTPARRNAAKTHCPAGHEYTPENTREQRRGSGTMRSCRTCIADRARARRRQR